MLLCRVILPLPTPSMKPAPLDVVWWTESRESDVVVGLPSFSSRRFPAFPVALLLPWDYSLALLCQTPWGRKDPGERGPAITKTSGQKDEWGHLKPEPNPKRRIVSKSLVLVLITTFWGGVLGGRKCLGKMYTKRHTWMPSDINQDL